MEVCLSGHRSFQSMKLTPFLIGLLVERSMIKFLFIMVYGFLIISNVHAYPGMQRLGYFNCTSCHISPSGGGVLNEYGRELSGEVLSAWSQKEEPKAENKFLYGSLANYVSKKWNFGGDIRGLSTYVDNSLFKEKRFFLMQADGESAYQIGNFTFDLELGYVDSDEIQSLRHYIMYQLDDLNALRVGKFKNNFGINTDEHQLTTKSSLGFGAETETYNIEYSRLSDSTALFITGIFGAPESEVSKRGLTIGRVGVVDHGASVRASYFFNNTEIGINSFYGKKAMKEWRMVSGFYGIIGLTKRIYYMGEFDFQDQSKWGFFNNQRLSYEWFQGFQTYLNQELALAEFGPYSRRILRYGFGMQFFPRPHFEISFRCNLEENLYNESRFYPNGWLLLHYYL